MLRRLEPDDPLLKEAFHWDDGAPPWFRTANTVFGENDEEAFLRRDSIFIGILDSELIAVIVLTRIAPHIYEADLLAKRGANLETISAGASVVVNDFLNMGMKLGFCWVAEKNLAVRKLCGKLNLTHDGLTLYRGSYRGRVTRWLRYSIQPTAVAIAA